mmetsp:Transcript_2321/g.3477  ORF Transcript_2321/g.3477 Transcript_2321/m.3477 type:complete len:167 (+) Transcript_2321:1459-1959(+)
MIKVRIIARGTFLLGFFASPETQHISSKPIYPKNELVAPRKIPAAPNSGGIRGVKFSFLAKIIDITAINITNETFKDEKKFVTDLDSFTPSNNKSTEPNDTTNAHGLMPSPGSSIEMRNDSLFLDLMYSSTLSPQDLATALALPVYSNVKHAAAMTEANSPIVSLA